LHPQGPPPVSDIPADWDGPNCGVYVAEARRDMDQQIAEKRDVRARAQSVFTTALVLGAAIAASYRGHDPIWQWTLVYVLAAGLNILAGLAAAGVITAKSVVGAPNLDNLLATSGPALDHALVREYAATRFAGAATVAVLVTVLRGAVLVLVLAFLAFAVAHIGT
jgi:hypothetical protein